MRHRSDRRIHHHGPFDARPRKQQCHRILDSGDHPNVVHADRVHRGRDDQADAVIAPKRIAKADHDRARRHSRCTLNVKKCVAQEIQGS